MKTYWVSLLLFACGTAMAQTIFINGIDLNGQAVQGVGLVNLTNTTLPVGTMVPSIAQLSGVTLNNHLITDNYLLPLRVLELATDDIYPRSSNGICFYDERTNPVLLIRSGTLWGAGGAISNLTISAGAISGGHLSVEVLPSGPSAVWNADGLLLSNAVLRGNGAGLTGLTAGQIGSLGTAAFMSSNELARGDMARLGAGAKADELSAAVGQQALATNNGVSLGAYANGSASGAGVGQSADGSTYGAAVGLGANGANWGAAVGALANAGSWGTALGAYTLSTNSGVALGLFAKGANQGVAIGGYSDGTSRGTALGFGSWASDCGAALGTGANGTDYGAAIGVNANGTNYGVAIGYWAQGTRHGTALGQQAVANDGGAALGLFAVGTNFGTAFGVNANGATLGVALGGWADGNYFGTAVGGNACGSNGGLGLGYQANGADQGMAVGSRAIGTNFGTAVGTSASGSDYGVAIGMRASAAGRGNVALGGVYWDESPTTVPSTWSDTFELGSGTATLQGGLNFRGYGIVNSNGVVVAPISASDLVVQGGLTLTNGVVNLKGATVTGLNASQIAQGQLPASVLPCGTTTVWDAGGLVVTHLVLAGLTIGSNSNSFPTADGIVTNLIVCGSATVSNLMVIGQATLQYVPAQGDLTMGSFTSQP